MQEWAAFENYFSAGPAPLLKYRDYTDNPSNVPPRDGTGPVLATFLFSSPPGESMVPQGLRRTQPPTLPRSSKMMLGKWHASNAGGMRNPVAKFFLALVWICSNACSWNALLRMRFGSSTLAG